MHLRFPAAARFDRQQISFSPKIQVALPSSAVNYLAKTAGAVKHLILMEWNIQSRAHACQSCKKQFADKEPFHTLLFDQKGGYERLDVCSDCWRAQFSQGAIERKGFVSYWQSVYSVPPATPPEPIQKETAETLLRKLVERNDPTEGPARYILGAMLERKRIFKIKTQLSRDGRRVFIYEHAKSGDLFQIEDPNLQLDQLESVQHEVLHLLQHGLDGEAAASASNNVSPETAANQDQSAQASSIDQAIREGVAAPAATGLAGVA